MSKRFQSRVYAVYGVAITFAVMTVSGLMLLLAPQGRLAKSIDWHLFGLGRDGWEAVHNATSFAFIGLALWHLLVHWSVVRSFLVGSRAQPASHRPEALAMLALVALLVLTAVLDLPPARWLVDLNAYFKMEYWGQAITAGGH